MPLPVFNATTGHYYQGVVLRDVSWAAAQTAAAAASYRGLKGYLATITSATENASVLASLTPVAGRDGVQPGYFLGASDLTDGGAQGAWRWKTGPEAGTALGYTNWQTGEPNNGSPTAFGAQDYLAILSSSTAPALNGRWDDAWGAAATGLSTISNGYVVEYGGLTPTYETEIRDRAGNVLVSRDRSINLPAKEGDPVTLVVYTVNVEWGRTVGYSVTGSGITRTDFSGGALSGQITISPQDPTRADSDGVARLPLVLSKDGRIEGPETMTFAVGNVSAPLVINDASRWRVEASAAVANEGDTVTFNVYTGADDIGQTFNYAISGDGIAVDDFEAGLPADNLSTALSGSITIAASGLGGLGKVTMRFARDQITEGTEALNFTVTDARFNSEESAPLAVRDTSRILDGLSYSAAAINEGESAVFLLRVAPGIPVGTEIPYTVSGSIDGLDVVGGLQGITTVTAGGQAVIAIPTVVDLLAESMPVTQLDGGGNPVVTTLLGVESLTVTASGLSATVQVRDWNSKPTFKITPLAGTASEGGMATFLVRTTGLMPGSGVRYEIGGSVDTDDFSSPWGGNWGVAKVAGTVASGQTTISIPIRADRVSEGSETLTLILGDGIVADLVGNRASVTIADTSKSPTYTLKATQSSYREGTTAFFTLTTTNVDPLSWVDYQLAGTGIDAADVGIALQGRLRLDNNGQGKLLVPLRADRVAEGGSEQLSVEIVGTPAFSTITVIDT